MHSATRRAMRFFALFTVALFLATTSSRAVSAYTLLHPFTGTPGDGAGPYYGTLATDGSALYGFTISGGATTNKGVVFKLNVSGSGYQVLHSFTGLNIADIILHNPGNLNDGWAPYGTPLLIGSTLYGTTAFGGTNGQGTVFKINTDGSAFAVLHNFGTGSDGSIPYGSLITDGSTIYGMASSGGSGLGVIFAMDTAGASYHLLHTFSVSTNDGSQPQGSLLLSGGILYGMTKAGGPLGSGTIFKISTNGTGFQLIHSFTGTTTDGSAPYGSLINSGSTLYGMTSAGGANGVGTAFRIDINGNSFTILHNFSTSDTWGPFGDLTLSGTTLYGMSRNSGLSLLGFGTIFQVNTDGSGFQIPHVFSFGNPSNLTDGSTPNGSLLLIGTKLYGMTYFGGSAANGGTVFSFDISGGGGGGPVTALRVNILPSGAVKAGAQWKLNAGTLQNSGALLTGINPGPAVIVYGPVTGWTPPNPQIISITAGITNTFSGTYTAADITVPTLKVISPTAKTTVNSNLFTATGTASDNAGVALVYYQLNGGGWTACSSGNSFTNWTAPNLSLSPGVNTLKFYAKDLSGNVSVTNGVSFTYIVSAPIVINLNPPKAGTIKGAVNGQLLQIGNSYSLSVKAAKGYAFLNWTGGTNSTSTKLTFIMASNLTLNANFKDIARPVNAILIPTKGQVLSVATPTASGRAMDNTGVTAVWCRVNSGNWFQANLADGTNWQTGDLSTQLLAGANTISAYALDAAGNASLTNTIAFSFTVQPTTDWAPNTLNGLIGNVLPTAGSHELVGFDASTFSQTGGTTDPNDFGGGTYTYVKSDTNLAQLSLNFTLPTGTSNSLVPISLIFTNHYSGYFTNSDGDSGGISLAAATAFVPATVVGKTITAVSSGSGKTTKIKLATATTFTKTPANNSNSGTSSGNYTFTRLSPVCAVFNATFTSAADAGQSAYLQLTYTSATGGIYFVMVFDNLGALQDVDTGTFTM